MACARTYLLSPDKSRVNSATRATPHCWLARLRQHCRRTKGVCVVAMFCALLRCARISCRSPEPTAAFSEPSGAASRTAAPSDPGAACSFVSSLRVVLGLLRAASATPTHLSALRLLLCALSCRGCRKHSGAFRAPQPQGRLERHRGACRSTRGNRAPCIFTCSRARSSSQQLEAAPPLVLLSSHFPHSPPPVRYPPPAPFPRPPSASSNSAFYLALVCCVCCVFGSRPTFVLGIPARTGACSTGV